MPFQFLFTLLLPADPRASKTVMRDDTAGTELPFATPRSVRDCPLG
jgi:hypothetical protein